LADGAARKELDTGGEARRGGRKRGEDIASESFRDSFNERLTAQHLSTKGWLKKKVAERKS